jgi:hypothetical protein
VPLQVKELLESGHTLHYPLLAALTAKFGAFIASIGYKHYNFFLLPIFTFIRKCCGATDADLEHQLEVHKLQHLVYAPPGAPPRPVTPLTPQRSSRARASSSMVCRHQLVSDFPDCRCLSYGSHCAAPRMLTWSINLRCTSCSTLSMPGQSLT